MLGESQSSLSLVVLASNFNDLKICLREQILIDANKIVSGLLTVLCTWRI